MVTFYVDAMLGKLGRMLRILGFDTLIADPTLTDEEIMEEALASERALVTRDQEFYEIFLKQKYPSGEKTQSLLLKDVLVVKQLTSVAKFFGFNADIFLADPENLVKRCSKCNSPVREVPKDVMKGLVEEGTFANHDRFWKCTNRSCQSLYWVGSHWQNLLNTFEDVHKRLR